MSDYKLRRGTFEYEWMKSQALNDTEEARIEAKYQAEQARMQRDSAAFMHHEDEHPIASRNEPLERQW